MDFSVTQEVLRAYGDTVKEAMKQVLWAIAAARQDGVAIDVSGMDEFDIDDFGTELDDAKKLLELGIGSETLKKQVFKKLAFKYLCDARQEIKNQVAEEIDAGRGGQFNAETRRAQRKRRAPSFARIDRLNLPHDWQAGAPRRCCHDAHTETGIGRYMEGIDIQAIVRQAVQEFVNNEQAKSEPAYKAECRRSGSGASNWSAG